MSQKDLYSELITLLDKHGAKYRLIDHKPEGRTEIVSPMRGNKLSQAAKCMILIVKLGKKETKYLLAVVPGDTKIDLDAVKTLLNASYVSFASADIAQELAGSVVGTVLPFSFNPKLELIVDPSLLENEEIFFNAARLDRSMALKTEDYLSITKPRLEHIAKNSETITVQTKDTSSLQNLRHSCAHLLAAAVMDLWPNAKRTIGPAIENGFYYDFDFGDVKVSEDDFPKIEAKMLEIVASWKNFERKELDKTEALRLFKGNEYKKELIEEFSKDGQTLTLYQSGNYVDLCRGGHSEHPEKELIYFKLLSIAGAYWRGDEKNKMLTRIYGTCFPTKEELAAHLLQLAEAKKRDHRVLGPLLDLFVINEDIGKGLPLLTPKGTIIRNAILEYERKLEREMEFTEVWTPSIAKSDIYKRTGHWDHYRDVMYAPFGIDNETYVLKPMNCPHHYMIYASRPRSYRDLPMRLSEPGTCYRYEKSGELGGLTRVRALTIDDSHILMREDQIHEEFDRCISMVRKMFEAFNLKDYFVRLSLNDPSDADKNIPDAGVRKKAADSMETIIKDNKLQYEVGSGEASFYGPKIDFMVRDAIGRLWQMSTLQLDLFMAKRLGLVYIDSDGKEKHPVILHRGLTGSIERTLGILIEHYAGAFPAWLAPVQVAIIPIAERHNEAANKAVAILREKGIRVEIDDRNESMQAKIRDNTLQKVPYLGIIGDREANSDTLSVRTRKGEDLKAMSLENFLIRIGNEIEHKL